MTYDSMIETAIHFRVLSLLTYVCTGEFRETEDSEDYRNGTGQARIVRGLDVRGVCELVLMSMIRKDVMIGKVLRLPELRMFLQEMADNGHIVRGTDIYGNMVYHIPQATYDNAVNNLKVTFEKRGFQVVETEFIDLTPQEYIRRYGNNA